MVVCVCVRAPVSCRTMTLLADSAENKEIGLRGGHKPSPTTLPPSIGDVMTTYLHHYVTLEFGDVIIAADTPVLKEDVNSTELIHTLKA